MGWTRTVAGAWSRAGSRARVGERARIGGWAGAMVRAGSRAGLWTWVVHGARTVVCRTAVAWTIASAGVWAWTIAGLRTRAWKIAGGRNQSRAGFRDRTRAIFSIGTTVAWTVASAGIRIWTWAGFGDWTGVGASWARAEADVRVDSVEDVRRRISTVV